MVLFSGIRSGDGTRAAKSQEPEVAESVKEEWNKALLDLLDRQVAMSAPKRVGTLTEILVEGPSKTNESRLTGRSRQNRPVVFDGGHVTWVSC